MSIKIAGADIKNVIAAGVEAKSVRLGTGSANVEVWSAVPPDPYVSLGASNRLDFTNGLTDVGASPRTWSVSSGTLTIQNGHLASGYLSSSSGPMPILYGEPFSASMWISPYGSSTSVSLALRIYAGPNVFLTFRYRQSDRQGWWDRKYGGASQQVYSVGTLPTGWSFIAAVVEPVSGTTWRFRCYLNGAELTNTTWDAGSPDSFSNFPALYCGNANVDDFALFPSALSAANIQSLYLVGRSV